MSHERQNYREKYIERAEAKKMNKNKIPKQVMNIKKKAKSIGISGSEKIIYKK